MEIIGLSEEALLNIHYQFSGGQRQRSGAVLANLLFNRRRTSISVGDLSVQAQVLNHETCTRVPPKLLIHSMTLGCGTCVMNCSSCTVDAKLKQGKMKIFSTRTHNISIQKRLLLQIPVIDPENREAKQNYVAKRSWEILNTKINPYYDEKQCVWFTKNLTFTL